MSMPRMFKRRQVLALGGTGIAGFLSGGVVAANVINKHTPPAQPVQDSLTSLTQTVKGSQMQDVGPYLNPGAYNQQFLAKTANVRQIWDFATIEQVRSDGGFAPIKNALNAFQFVYKKSLYPLICLRGSAVIYGLDDAMWAKYNLGAVYGLSNEVVVDSNPLYQRLTPDNGSLSPQDPGSFYQDYSLQALLQRGAYIAACHDGLNGVSSTLAEHIGIADQVIFKDLTAHLVFGALQTPSGSSLIAVAQYLGFTYATQ